MKRQEYWLILTLRKMYFWYSQSRKKQTLRTSEVHFNTRAGLIWIKHDKYEECPDTKASFKCYLFRKWCFKLMFLFRLKQINRETIFKYRPFGHMITTHIPKWFPSLSLHTCRHRDPSHNVLKTSFHGFHCAWGNADNAHCLKHCLLHIMAEHKQSFQTSSHSASHTGAQDGGCNSSRLYPSTSGNGC